MILSFPGATSERRNDCQCARHKCCNLRLCNQLQVSSKHGQQTCQRTSIDCTNSLHPWNFAHITSHVHCNPFLTHSLAAGNHNHWCGQQVMRATSLRSIFIFFHPCRFPHKCNNDTLPTYNLCSTLARSPFFWPSCGYSIKSESAHC